MHHAVSESCPTRLARRRRALRRIGAGALLAAGLGAAPAGTAWAQSDNTGPLRLIVAYPPGGSADILARMLGQKLGQILNRTIVVDNRAGAGGMIGLNAAAQAAPDGNTIYLCALTTQIIGTLLNKNARYDVVRDLEPVALMASAPHVLVVHPSVPARDFKEFAAWLNSRSGKVDYASGFGTLSHLEGILLGQKLNVKLNNIPYKGSSQAVTDLLSGTVSFMFDSIPSSLPLINSGKVRAMAVASTQRMPALEQLPTLVEAGIPGYDVNNWFGLFAPKGTAKPMIDAVDRAVAEVLKDKDFTAKMAQNGYTPKYGSSAELARVGASDVKRWGGVIRAANLSL
ncbi:MULTISPECIES: Bug family tripartite tricarboxylate transporter substrate binding protein [Cupriavidus]